MGSGRQYDGVRPASASTIEIDFYYAGKRCRERIKLEPTPANLKRAAQHRAAILDAIARQTFDYAVTFPESENAKHFAKHTGDVLKVAEFLDGWLTRKEQQLKASTWDDYRKAVNYHLIPGFGKLALSALTRPVVREWCSKLTCGNKRIGNLLSILRSALDEAEDDELIEANPIKGWSYTKAEPPKDEDDVDPFNAKEQAAILAKLDGQARNLIQFAFWTGLRTSEMVALDWSDIDFKAGIVRVRKATTLAAAQRARRAALVPDAGEEAGKLAIERPKTSASRRDVKLLQPALDALLAQKLHTLIKGEEVFQNPRTGERWLGDQPIRLGSWTRALRKAEVRYRNPYQTRHTYASMMLSAGEHPMWVAQQMGHRDWGMIRKIYGRFIPDADPDAGGRAERVFGSAQQSGRKASKR
jgi:integrase